MYTNGELTTHNLKLKTGGKSILEAFYAFVLNPKRIIFSVFAIIVFTGFAFVNILEKVSAAQGINKQINFQGKLVNSNGTNVADGTYDVVFKIYTVSTGGAAVWTESWTGANKVTVTGGIFQVQLGSITAFPGSVDFGSDNIYLGVTVGADSEMTPRIRFASVPQAFNAEKVNGLTVVNTAGNPFSSTTTFRIADGKTVSINNGLTFAGTDSTTFTFPTSTGSVVTEDFTQTLTNKTIGSTGLTFNGATTDITTVTNENFSIVPNGSGKVGIHTTGGLASLDIRANSVAGGTIAVASVSGTTSFAGLLVDNNGLGDIFTASKSGATKFIILNNGNLQFAGETSFLTTLKSAATAIRSITFPDETGTLCIQSSSACGFAVGANLWQSNSNAISPSNSTYDVLFGATSTSSAKFAFLNNGGGTPTASISANSGNIATTLTGTGVLGTTNMQTLALGNSSTGFINIDSGASKINLLDNTTILGTLDGLTGLTLASGGITLGGTAGTGSQCLLGGATASWGSCTAGVFNSPFRELSGAIVPLNSTLDTLLGGQSSASAAFKVTGQENPFAGTQVGASVSANTSFASFVVDNRGVGDIFTASKSGATKFTILNNGNIQFAGTTNFLTTLTSNATAARSIAFPDETGTLCIQGSTNCGFTVGSNYWQLNSNALSPSNSTYDVLFGATATTSAKFAFLNNAGGTPTASISANSGNIATTLTGLGVLGTTNMQTLTLGNSTTGNIVIDSGSGVTTLADATVNLTGATASRFILTDASKNLVYSGLSSVLSDTLSDETGTGGVAVFSTSPSITTSLTTGSTSFDLIDTTATTVNFARGATTSLTIGATTGTLSLQHPTVNVGGGGAATIATVSDDSLTLTAHGAGELALTSDFDSGVNIGLLTNTPAVLSVSGGIGANAAFIVNNINSGDLFSASASGVTKFVIKNDGTASSSAGFTINAAGNLQTTNGNTLTLGGNTTGFINIDSASGKVNILDNTSLSGTLDSLTGLTLASGPITLGGVTGDTLCLKGGATASWGACGGSSSENFWQYNTSTGILAPGNLTTDLLVGGVSSSSASFRVTGNSAFRGTTSAASVSANTSFAGLVVDNKGTGDIFTASSSGMTRFTVQQSGIVQIGSITNGLTFDYLNGGPTYTGTGRPTKKIVLSAEYAGAVLTASGSATTTGSMTSDASPSAALSNWRNYYEWTSSQTSLNDYTVAVRVHLPQDFSAWATTNAITISYNTELVTTDSQKLDVIIYNADTSLSAQDQATPVVYRQNNVSATQKTWLDMSIDDSDLTDGGSALDAAGDVMVIYLKMFSKDNNYVQVGNIALSYLSKF